MANEICAVCGEKIEQNWSFCPFCGVPIIHYMDVWECPKCGATYEHDGKEHPHGIICPSCLESKYTMVGILHRIRIPNSNLKEETDDGNNQG